MEKPVATDAPGIRRVLAVAEEAKKKNLKVAVGLQRRHQPGYRDAVKLLQDGAAGTMSSWKSRSRPMRRESAACSQSPRRQRRRTSRWRWDCNGGINPGIAMLSSCSRTEQQAPCLHGKAGRDRCAGNPPRARSRRGGKEEEPQGGGGTATAASTRVSRCCQAAPGRSSRHHVFMEKPVATDAPGIRRVLAVAEEAKKKNL